MANEIKGLINITTGEEINDADVRFSVLFGGYGPPTGTVSGTNSRRNSLPGDYYIDRDSGDVYVMSPDVVTTYCVWDSDNSDMDEYFFVAGSLNAVKNGNGIGSVRGSIGVSSGKWYWELDPATAQGNRWHIGIGSDSTGFDGADFWNETDGKSYYALDGKKYDDGSSAAYGDTFSGTNIISVALDMDSGKIWWAKDGVWQASGDPANGTNEAFSGLTGTIYPMADEYYSGGQLLANFGQSAFNHSVPAGFNSGLYQASDEGIWNVVTSVSGSLQEVIDRIPVWYDGFGTPSGTLGAYKDYYLAKEDGDIFKKERYIMHSCTWNPSDKDAGIDLTNGNLTCSSNDTFTNSVRATDGVSSGKWYWEVTYDQEDLTATSYLGVANASAGLTQLCGWNANSWGYSETDGKIYFNSAGFAYGDTWSADDVIGIALDMDSGKVWFAKNGVWQGGGDPEAGTAEAFSGLTGTIYPCASPHKTDDTFTANFGASGFVYSAPAGFDTLTSWSAGWFRKWNPDGRYYTQTQVNTLSGTLQDLITAENIWARDSDTSIVSLHISGDNVDYGSGDLYGIGKLGAGSVSTIDDSGLTVGGESAFKVIKYNPDSAGDHWKLYVKQTGLPSDQQWWQEALRRDLGVQQHVFKSSAITSGDYDGSTYNVVIGQMIAVGGGYDYNLVHASVFEDVTERWNGHMVFYDAAVSTDSNGVDVIHDGTYFCALSRVRSLTPASRLNGIDIYYETNPSQAQWNRRLVDNTSYDAMPTSLVFDGTNYVVAGTRRATAVGDTTLSIWHSTTITGTSSWNIEDIENPAVGRVEKFIHDGTYYIAVGYSGSASPCIWYNTTLSGSWNKVIIDSVNNGCAYDIINDGSNYFAVGGRGSDPFNSAKLWYSPTVSGAWNSVVISGGGQDVKATGIVHNAGNYVACGEYENHTFSSGSTGKGHRIWYSTAPTSSGSWTGVFEDPDFYGSYRGTPAQYDYAEYQYLNDIIFDSNTNFYYSPGHFIAYEAGYLNSYYGTTGVMVYGTLISGSNPTYHVSLFTQDESGNEIDLLLEQKELTIFEPDQVSDEIPMFHVNDRMYPNGITVVSVSIQVNSDSAYTMGFEEWGGDPPSFQNTIEDVSTTVSGNYSEIENGNINDQNIAAGNWVFLDTPSTDVDWVVATCIFHGNIS